jgi:hypothetical protein
MLELYIPNRALSAAELVPPGRGPPGGPPAARRHGFANFLSGNRNPKLHRGSRRPSRARDAAASRTYRGVRRFVGMHELEAGPPVRGASLQAQPVGAHRRKYNPESLPRDCAEVVCHACRWLGGARGAGSSRAA